MRSTIVISGLLGILFGFAPCGFAWSKGQEDARLVPHSNRHYSNDPISFYSQFNNLMRNYDLIGLSVDTVKDWMGEPYKFTAGRLKKLKKLDIQIPSDEADATSIYYRIPRDEVKPSFHVIRLKLINNRVVQWSVVYNNEETKPVTSNVLIKFDRGGSIIFSNGNGFRYPETIEKPKPILNSERVEGPRDINLFNVEPTVLDERWIYDARPVKHQWVR